MTTSARARERLDAAIDELLREGATPNLAGPLSELSETARVLRDALPRFHPRFGFEELLAGRLKAAARERDGSATAAIRAPGQPVELPIRTGRQPARSQWRRRSLVAGGAIASGVSIALPIAGAAIVVWRRTRSSGGVL